MSAVSFIVESQQGSFIPVSATLVELEGITDYYLDPLSYSMPFVELRHAVDFIYDNASYDTVVLTHPVRMSPFGLKWLSEIERVQR